MLEDAIKFYYKATKLKDLLRQGAVVWQVSKPRMESIAEHTWGCLMLAIALHSELKLDLDLGKTLEMITIHELEELIIGDVTPLDDIPKASLNEKARNGVQKLIKDLDQKDWLLEITDEFNMAETKEGRFAHAIDKLENVLEFKKYQDMGYVSVNNATEKMLKNKMLKEYVECGLYDVADIFFLFHEPAYEEFGIDEEFWFNTLKHIKIN